MPLYQENGVLGGSGQEEHRDRLAMAEVEEEGVQGVTNDGVERKHCFRVSTINEEAGHSHHVIRKIGVMVVGDKASHIQAIICHHLYRIWEQEEIFPGTSIGYHGN